MRLLRHVALIGLVASTLTGCRGDLSVGAPLVEDDACADCGASDAGGEPGTAVRDGGGVDAGGADASSEDGGDGGDGGVEVGRVPVCGDGTIDPGEVCDGNCPSSCDDGNLCTDDVLTGSAESCDVVCESVALQACVDADGCCPNGCDRSTDDDCSVACGDGVIDANETCDPPGSCAASCDDADACTTDTRTGSAANCNVTCTHAAVVACLDADGCCAPGCNATNDDDCAPICGNGVREGAESCDGDCPSSCDDADACTTDVRSGSSSSCDVTCSNAAVTSCTDADGCCAPGCNATNDSDCAAVCGNGVEEPGESCDGDCPSSCGDGNACTTDTRSGSASSCSATCSYAMVTSCTDGDGCCAPGCSASNDDDCGPLCGNGVIEGGEVCDGDCPSSCDDDEACTTDVMSGSPGTCDATCSSSPVTACVSGAGCCPVACAGTGDNDCPTGTGIDCRDDATWPTDWKSFEAQVITLLNQERAAGADCGSRGVFGPAGPLSLNTALREAARCHSKEMAELDYFSHTGATGTDFVQRASTAGYGGSPRGENIAAGYATPSDVVAGWMTSDGHCANIMNSSPNRVGIGYVYLTGNQWTRYWTMVTGYGD